MALSAALLLAAAAAAPPGLHEHTPNALCLKFNGTDFSGHDGPGGSCSAKAASPAACCSQCGAAAGCKAWTWIPGDTCCFKRSAAGHKTPSYAKGYVSGCVSGKCNVPVSPPPPPPGPPLAPTPPPHSSCLLGYGYTGVPHAGDDSDQVILRTLLSVLLRIWIECAIYPLFGLKTR
jgi:hypothetical protein